MSDAPAPLDGVRVLDVTQGAFGSAGRLFAGLGADVIKVEPLTGDHIRVEPPFLQGHEDDPEASVGHLHFNSGKRSIAVDLESPAGVDVVHRLLRNCDVLFESFDRVENGERGVAYGAAREIKPDILAVALSHFGVEGPYAEYPSEDIVDGALSGYLMLTGDPDREPVKAYDDMLQQHTGLQAAVAAMCGLMFRDATGSGDLLDTSVLDAALFLHGGPIQNFYFYGQVTKRRGTRLLNTEPTGLYPSCLRPVKDGGWIHTHSNTRYPDLMSILMEEPRLSSEELLAEPNGHADEIDALMEPWLMKHDKFEAVRLAQELRLPFTEVLLPSEVLKDEHLAFRHFFQEVDHPTCGKVVQVGAPAVMSETPWRVSRAPLLGEHTADVLAEAGFSDEERDQLTKSGVVR